MPCVAPGSRLNARRFTSLMPNVVGMLFSNFDSPPFEFGPAALARGQDDAASRAALGLSASLVPVVWWKPTCHNAARYDDTMSDAQSWRCLTCDARVSTPYCPGCGERRLHERDLTLRGIVDQLVRAFSPIDGRLFRSFRCLLGRPGLLTVAYLQGQRRPYVGPVPLFLIANGLFFATEALAGGKVFTTPIDSHLHTQPWSGVAEVLVSRRLEEMQTTLDVYAPVFDQALARNARSLVIFMALFFVAAPSLAFHRSRLPFGVHAIFSFHVYAFLLLLFCVATVAPPVDLWFGGAGFASDRLDYAVSGTLLLACGWYLHVATAHVYGASGASRAVRVVALTVTVAAISLGYRFVLLLITLYTT